MGQLFHPFLLSKQGRIFSGKLYLYHKLSAKEFFDFIKPSMMFIGT